MAPPTSYVRWFDELRAEDVAQVGGKNASLGEMICALKHEGIRVPDGFATTAAAYRTFLEANLGEFRRERTALEYAGKALRKLVRQAALPDDLMVAIRRAYRELSERYGVAEVDVAVRSSATAEDLPEASFAGQQDTFLNITGEDELLEACRDCYASLFTDRALSYRQEQGFDHLHVALSVGVQKMVRADTGSAGGVFFLDNENGVPPVVIIKTARGLGG